MSDIFNFDQFISGDFPNNDKILKESSDVESVDAKEEEKKVVKEEPKKEEVKEVVEESEPIEEKVEEVDESDSYFKLYKDKVEEFTCNIEIEGSSIEETYARIIVESEDWTLVFPGEIRNGKCIVPIKKLNILKENEIGNIKLEVVTEGNLFIPWEDKFKVKLSKKVTVSLNESKKPTPVNKGIGVKVSR